MKKIILFVLIIIILLLPLSLAHQGKTDSYGGHYDTSSGEYHYHHGYSAHQHINGLCPYEDDLDDLLPSKCPECNSIVNAENGYYCFECGYELAPLSGIILSSVDGDATKTRSEYFKEVQDLKGELEEKENIINGLMTSSSEKDNSINILEEENTNLKNISSILIFVTFILCIIFYAIGNHQKDKSKQENLKDNK